MANFINRINKDFFFSNKVLIFCVMTMIKSFYMYLFPDALYIICIYCIYNCIYCIQFAYIFWDLLIKASGYRLLLILHCWGLSGIIWLLIELSWFAIILIQYTQAKLDPHTYDKHCLLMGKQFTWIRNSFPPLSH